MYPIILLWCWVHLKHAVMLRPWPVAISTAHSSLWNKLNHKAKWDQSLIDMVINNHRIWVDCSQFGVNGFFVIMPWYLAVIQTLNKCHSAGKIPGAHFFTGEILEGCTSPLQPLSELHGGLSAVGQASEVFASLSVKVFCYQNWWKHASSPHHALQQKVKSLFQCYNFKDSDL